MGNNQTNGVLGAISDLLHENRLGTLDDLSTGAILADVGIVDVDGTAFMYVVLHNEHFSKGYPISCCEERRKPGCRRGLGSKKAVEVACEINSLINAGYKVSFLYGYEDRDGNYKDKLSDIDIL